jgi:WD40 repeat protein/serine/threonine protein kinase/tetratricopeptide (TPR) repeat protein
VCGTVIAAHTAEDCAEPATLLPSPAVIVVSEAMTVTETAAHVQPDNAADLPKLSRPDQTLAEQPSVPGYEILGELGRGGMGVVYKARQISLNRLVALKMILAGPHAGVKELARFRTEAEAVARLQHPNIVQIHEVGEWRAGDVGSPMPYFSLEYVDGGSLDKKLQGTPQPPREAAGLIETLARAVHAAHQRGIVHRDLKPANILLAFSGQRSAVSPDPGAAPVGLTAESCSLNALPKITDFGLAKKLDESAGPTASGAIMGTPSYMAPEQAGGHSKSIGPATDVYALGAILYELLTGRPPFKAATSLDTVLQVIADEPVPPSRLNSKLPRDLETICLKCLQKEAGKRYGSALALADDLRRFQVGEPIQARPVGPAEKLWRWGRRNPVVASLTAVVAALLLMVSVIATLAAVRLHHGAVTERDLRAEAEQARKEAEAKAEESRQRLTRLNVTTGVHYLDRGDLTGAQAWFAEALGRDQGHPGREEVHRVRLAAVRRACPRLVQVWAHDLPVQHAEFSSDGRHILAACGGLNQGWGAGDGEAHVWDVASGKAMLPVVKHNYHVVHAAFSPDGRQFVTACGDQSGQKGEARVWDTATGAAVSPPLVHRFEVRHAAFSPDGRYLVTASGPIFGQGGEARVWEVATGQAVTAPLAHAGSVKQASFSPDGRRIVTASGMAAWGPGQGEGRVWDVATGQSIAGPLAHAAMVTEAWFSPDGQQVVTASQDGTARVWDAATGRPVTPPLRHSGPVNSAAFSPDGRRVATASQDGTAQVWDMASGAPATPLLRHTGPVQHVAFSPLGGQLVTAAGETLADEGEARVWDAATGTPVTPLLKHNGQVRVAVFSPDGRHVLTAGGDKAIRLWDIAGAGPVIRSIEDSRAGIQLAVSSDGRFAVTAHPDRTAQVWDLVTSRPVAPRLPHTKPVLTALFSAGGSRLLTVCMGVNGAQSQARVWDVATGRPVTSPLRVASVPGFGVRVAFSDDGHFAALPGDGGSVQLVDAATPGAVTLLRDDDPAMCLTFCRDGRYLATASGRGTDQNRQVRVWETATGRPVTGPLKHQYAVQQAAFSPDGRLLATACSFFRLGDPLGMGEARIWDVTKGAMVAPPLEHRGAVTQVAFSPEAGGRTIATASNDWTAQVWTAAGEPVTPPLHHGGPVAHVGFSPGGRYVLTASGDTVRVWETATGDPVAPPWKHAWQVREASFSADGLAVIVARARPGQALGQVWTWDLRPDDRPVADLARASSLLAGRRIDAVGGFVPVPAAVLRDELDALRGQRPEDFAASPEESLAWHRRQAAQYEAVPDLFAALAHLNALIAAEPKRAALHTRRGRVLAAHGLPDEALAAYTKAIELQSDDWRPWYGRGMVHEERRRWDAALRDYAEAGRLNPEQWDVWLRQGRASATLGRLDEALTQYSQAVALNAPGADPWVERGEVHARLRHWNEATADFANALLRGERSARVWCAAALVRLAAGDVDGYRKARTDLFRAFGQTPDPDTVDRVVRTCVLAPGAPAEVGWAVQLAQKAVASHAKNATYRANLGAALYRTDRFEESLRQVEQAIEADGQGGTTWDWLFLAMAHQRLGHADEARQWLDKAVSAIEGAAQKKPAKAAATSSSWEGRLEIELLRAEAEAPRKKAKR